jgi:hypothetical protein
MFDPVFTIQFNSNNYAIVHDTHNSMDVKYSARIVDPVGLGFGDTRREALLSLCESLRSAADSLEAKIIKDVNLV